MKKLTTVLAILVLTVSLLAAAAFAAYGQSSVSMQGEPTFGGTVWFLVWTHRTYDPYVQVECYQAGQLVYKETNGVYSPLNDGWTLGPTENWTGGDADCTATAMLLQHGGLKPIGGATLDFVASG